MDSLTRIRLLGGCVIHGGVYFAGDVVALPDGEAHDLMRQGMAEAVHEVNVMAGPANPSGGDDDA